VSQPRAGLAFARRLLFRAPHGSLAGSFAPHAGKAPSIVFWAWERPEDFRFLAADEATVAFLAKTIYLQPAAPSLSSAPAFFVRPRLQPLRVTPGVPLIAVVRIETATPPRLSDFASPPTAPALYAIAYSPQQREALASEIAALKSIPGISAIQIDFDAPTSAHPFYAALLQDVRRKLPRSLTLSITALASWCIGDHWLAQLPPGTIDEAVPMLFRMGPAAGDVVKFLHSGSEFPVAPCQSSLGLSTDERISGAILSDKFAGLASSFRGKKMYVFSARSQTTATAQAVLEEWRP